MLKMASRIKTFSRPQLSLKLVHTKGSVIQIHHVKESTDVFRLQWILRKNQKMTQPSFFEDISEFESAVIIVWQISVVIQVTCLFAKQLRCINTSPRIKIQVQSLYLAHSARNHTFHKFQLYVSKVY